MEMVRVKIVAADVGNWSQGSIVSVEKSAAEQLIRLNQAERLMGRPPKKKRGASKAVSPDELSTK